MVRFISFTSGSCGNCSFLGNESEGILIDAGVSMRRLKKYLADNQMSFDNIKAVLVTHDHLDHIRHLGSYCKKLNLPVYTTPKIHAALSRHNFTQGAINPCRKDICTDEWTEIAGMKVLCFEVPHDATQTVGYAITIGGHKFVIMTDIGRMTEEALNLSRHADTVVIESNYDLQMLLAGSYTYELKMRIIQGCGHLSNDECSDAIKSFYHPELKNLILCHLSENNNTPEMALKSARAALDELGVPQGSVALRHLPRHIPSPMFYL